MNVLGVSASSRPWGNTDILVQHALRGAASGGAETRFLRLTDLALQPCSGCMRCVFKGCDCVLEDRLKDLLDAWRWADAVALGSPTYVLGATGALKTLQDRLLRHGASREFAGKPGLALAAAGVRGWEPFALPQISQVFLFLGMPVVDQFVGYAQGPGEMFDDPAACRRAREDGEALARGETAYRGGSGACPVCHFDLVTVRSDGKAYCLLCDLEGERIEGPEGLRLLPVTGQARWSEPVIREHFEGKIVPSGPRFKARLRELRATIDAFRQGD